MDTIIHIRKSGRRETYYRATCLSCHKDKGYVRKDRIDDRCNTCVGKINGGKNKGKLGPNKGKIFSKETRLKMSQAKQDYIPWNKGLKEERYDVRLKMSLAKVGVVPWNKGTGNPNALDEAKRLLRYRTRKFIKGSPKHQEFAILAGCTREELIKHIESKFQQGMTWKNWSATGWHLDHIRPLASFDLSDPEQIKEACHYTNIQPLWAEDNLKKADKITF